MRPAVVQAMYEALPIAESCLFTKSGHMSMIDEPETMNNAVANFLDRVEMGNFVARRSPEFSNSNKSPTTMEKNSFLVWLPWQHMPVVIVAVTTLMLAFGQGLTVGQHRERLQRRDNDAEIAS